MNEQAVPNSIARRNQLLAAFPEKALARVVAEAEVCALALKDEVFEPDEPITHVHFPTSCVLSLLVAAGRSKVEVATVGREGVVGVPLFLGGNWSSTSAVTQIPGQSLRVSGALLDQLVEDFPDVRLVLGRYVQAMMALMGQSVACNRLHPVEARCARWLLITRDRADAESFPVTQQFLAQMLGVRRASVTVAAGLLQKRGLIRYSRGKVAILDGQGLEKAACECYELVADRYRRLLPGLNGNGSSGATRRDHNGR